MINNIVLQGVSLYLYFFYLLILVFSGDVKIITTSQVIGQLHNRVHIKNESELIDKFNKLMRVGYSGIQIITDFDNTLTLDSGVPGKYVLNSFEMLRNCPSVPQSYKDEEFKLYRKYKPIEISTHLSDYEKAKHMVQWYKEAENLMRGMKFPRQELQEIAAKVSKSFRYGVSELVTLADQHKIPMIVISSGLGDALTATFDAANISSSYLRIISNFLDINNEDIIVGMKGAPIHSFNKNEASLQDTDFFDLLKNRPNVLLIGDSLGDANMADALNDINTIIKIGYLNVKNIDQLPAYLDRFDIVLKDDETMSTAIGIIKLLD